MLHSRAETRVLSAASKAREGTTASSSALLQTAAFPAARRGQGTGDVGTPRRCSLVTSGLQRTSEPNEVEKRGRLTGAGRRNPVSVPIQKRVNVNLDEEEREHRGWSPYPQMNSTPRGGGCSGTRWERTSVRTCWPKKTGRPGKQQGKPT